MVKGWWWEEAAPNWKEQASEKTYSQDFFHHYEGNLVRAQSNH